MTGITARIDQFTLQFLHAEGAMSGTRVDLDVWSAEYREEDDRVEVDPAG